jgi:hypothetical protein
VCADTRMEKMPSPTPTGCEKGKGNLTFPPAHNVVPIRPRVVVFVHWG